jgi:gluconokinase
VDSPQAIVIMGVSGSGKTSVGVALAEKLGWPFFDGDDYHLEESVAKMAAGHSLDDHDRAPWLTILNGLIHEHLQLDESLVLACSALKYKYRVRLAQHNPGTIFVYLCGDIDLICRRMQARKGHFMRAEMLQSQVDTLEEPQDAIVVQIDQSIENIVAEIIAQLPKN